MSLTDSKLFIRKNSCLPPFSHSALLCSPSPYSPLTSPILTPSVNRQHRLRWQHRPDNRSRNRLPWQLQCISIISPSRVATHTMGGAQRLMPAINHSWTGGVGDGIDWGRSGAIALIKIAFFQESCHNNYSENEAPNLLVGFSSHWFQGHFVLFTVLNVQMSEKQEISRNFKYCSVGCFLSFSVNILTFEADHLQYSTIALFFTRNVVIELGLLIHCQIYLEPTLKSVR